MKKITWVDHEISKYEQTHGGAKPLFLILCEDEADELSEEVREKERYENHVVVTEYRGLKIVRSMAMKCGQLQLSNELPEIGG